MKLEKLLFDKQVEIKKIFSESDDLVVSLFDLDAPVTQNQMGPDVAILINKDSSQSEDLVISVLPNTRFLIQFEPSRRHDFFIVLTGKLKELLGCSINVVDEVGLKTFYPVTYSKYRR